MNAFSDIADGPRDRIRFGIVGSGWRSEFFLRVARELPDRFEVTGLVTRDEATGRRIRGEWNVRPFASVDDLVAGTSPSFVVVSVPRDVAPRAIRHLAGLNVPVLTETPPAPDVEALASLYPLVGRGAIIQVAEQYHLSPLLRSQLRVAASGRLGDISQVLVAQCHDYHAVSIMRRALGVGFDDVSITAARFRSPLVKGPDREGDPREEVTVTADQLSARFDFGDRLGVYDFAEQQYFSWIRANRLLIRGHRGEINDAELQYLDDAGYPVATTFRRVAAGEGGNLEGFFLRGIMAGSEWVFRNGFIPARLSDDELAIAECLQRMSDRVQGGPDLYSLAEASQDHYLSLLMQEAAITGEAVRSRRQVWSR
ncbi:Gfo/Idh/MocA family protein [Arthrobacter sp. NPDC092385]|uniref:Gfo/Idh/MocA family protein n=1 Tax=Arthrobacter sp. NPDC092385 TaxID=3363943 RepID=UPI0037F38E10